MLEMISFTSHRQFLNLKN